MSSFLAILESCQVPLESDDENWSSEDEEIVAILTNVITVKRNCIRNYFEDVVLYYSDTEFVRHFRVDRGIFSSLSYEYENSAIFQEIKTHSVFSPTKSIALFLWFAGHEATSFRDLADRFNLSLDTVHKILKRVTFFISLKSASVIKWPSVERMVQTERYYNSISPQNKELFPGVIGSVDGTHIRIDPPSQNKDSYIDRKRITSIVLQGACNEDKKFIHLFVGFPGSAHDARVYANSPLPKKLENIPNGFYLLGDSAYPCSRYLLVPYRDNGHLNAKQKLFNRRLSSARVHIEHTFPILKQRFRQLYYCKLKGIPYLCHFIRACCVLHNLSNESDLAIFNQEKKPDSEEDEVEEPEYVFNDVDEPLEGKKLREAVTEKLFNETTGVNRNHRR